MNEVDGNRIGDLGSVETGLQHRSVTVPSDEPLLIANLLHLDVTYILNGPCPLTNCANVGCDHSRIHRLWLLMPKAFRGIPRNVLLRIGPRLSEPGFRWAPSTLLYQESVNDTLQPRLASMDEVTPIASDRSQSSFYHLLSSTLPHLIPMLVSTFWQSAASTFCWMRANMEAFGWTSTILRNLRRTSSVTGSAERGIPTRRGLIVRFTG